MKQLLNALPLKHDYKGIYPDSIGIIPKNSPPKIPLSDENFHWQRKAALENERNIFQWAKKDEWLKYTADKFEAADVQRRVGELFCEEHNKLLIRQEKLRNLLRNEENKYYDEIMCLKEMVPDREETMKKVAKELFEKREAERVAFALEKYEQQFRNNSEELRNRSYLFSCERTAKEREEQMKQKRRLELLRSEEEKSFLALWQADAEMKNQREKEIKDQRRLATSQTHRTILEQIAQKEEKKKEEESIKAKDLADLQKEREEFEKEKIEEEKNKFKKRQKNIEEINEFIKKKKEKNEAERLREMEYNEKVSKQMDQATSESLQAKQDKKHLKTLQDNYLHYSHYVKDERLRQERCDDQLFHHEGNKYWSRWYERNKSSVEANKRELQNLNCERKQRIEQKYEEKANKLKKDRQEREAILAEARNHRAQEDRAAQALRQQNMEYYESLKCQMKYQRKMMVERQAEETRMLAKQQEAEEEYLRKVQYYKERPVVSQVHPLKKHLLFPELSCKSIFKSTLNPTDQGARYRRSGTLN